MSCSEKGLSLTDYSAMNFEEEELALKTTISLSNFRV